MRGTIYLEAAKAGSARKCDVADVGRAGAGRRLVDDQGAVLEVSPSRLFHLPKLLQGFHNVHCVDKKISLIFTALGAHPTSPPTNETLVQQHGQVILVHLCLEAESLVSRVSSTKRDKEKKKKKKRERERAF